MDAALPFHSHGDGEQHHSQPSALGSQPSGSETAQHHLLLHVKSWEDLGKVGGALGKVLLSRLGRGMRAVFPGNCVTGSA